MKKRVLTGINTTGTLHIGNYVGAIRPAIQDSKNPDVQSFFFMADLHALIKCQDPDRIERSRMQIAATWLAAGLDPERVVFYRQSDIPEIPLLNWMLTCCTSKGQMNRAHAYKAATDAAVAAGKDPDADVSMGLFCYPILMAADILMFNANEVPVGHDQIQHLEMARDVATRFNNLYAKPDESFFVLPQATGGSAIEVLPGLDGRKMSKSYNNVIPLFEGGRKALDEAISRIVTDSRLPGEPKDPDSTSLTVIYDAFATEEESAAFRQELRDGLGWGEAKKRLADKIDAEIGPMRQRYELSLIPNRSRPFFSRAQPVPASTQRISSPSSVTLSACAPSRNSRRLVPPRLKRRRRLPRSSSSTVKATASSTSSSRTKAPNCSFPTASNPAATQASGSAASRRTPPLSPRLLFTSLKALPPTTLSPF